MSSHRERPDDGKPTPIGEMLKVLRFLSKSDKTFFEIAVIAEKAKVSTAMAEWVCRELVKEGIIERHNKRKIIPAQGNIPEKYLHIPQFRYKRRGGDVHVTIEDLEWQQAQLEKGQDRRKQLGAGS